MSKVIYKLGNDVTANVICPNACMIGSDNPTPRDCAFLNEPGLRVKLDAITNGEAIAIVCGDNFGTGGYTLDAGQALLGYNLTIIAKSIDETFFNSCNITLKQRLIQCPTLSLGDIEVDDEVQIQTFKLINTKHKNPPIEYQLTKPIEIKL